MELGGYVKIRAAHPVDQHIGVPPRDQTLIQDHNELEDDLSSIVKKVDESVSLHQEIISFSIS